MGPCHIGSLNSDLTRNWLIANSELFPTPSFLLRFPEAQIADEILRSLEFTAADFRDPKSMVVAKSTVMMRPGKSA
jgi:hypothetical protein